ncbi:hypothetical protein BDR03DRAFT_548015 [Suillus americanus]|nr:hypothetical protein BDR03DRAFT_548015 [Suillus americanus]
MTEWFLSAPRNGYVVTGFSISLFHSTLGVGRVPRFRGRYQPYRRCMFPVWFLSGILINEFPTRLVGALQASQQVTRTTTPKTCIAGSCTMLPGRLKAKRNEMRIVGWVYHWNDSTQDGSLVSFLLVSASILYFSQSHFFPESVGAGALSLNRWKYVYPLVPCHKYLACGDDAVHPATRRSKHRK